MRNFFIIGAPKCGTTSMSRWLSEHPEVCMSPIKEPHYYSSDLKNRVVTSAARYAKLFSNVSATHRVIGEASTWYLYSNKAVPAIEQAYQNPKYIVMTRDPVEMAISLHHHNLRVLHENEPDLELAWRLQSDRAAGCGIPRGCVEPIFLQYRDVCSVGSQILRLYQHVPKERVLHITMDSLKQDPAGVYAAVLTFLEISHDGRIDFSVANEARGYRSEILQMLLRWGGRARIFLGIQRGFGLGRLNERPLSKNLISESFRKELELDFDSERRLLKSLSEQRL